MRRRNISDSGVLPVKRRGGESRLFRRHRETFRNAQPKPKRGGRLPTCEELRATQPKQDSAVKQRVHPAQYGDPSSCPSHGAALHKVYYYYNTLLLLIPVPPPPREKKELMERREGSAQNRTLPPRPLSYVLVLYLAMKSSGATESSSPPGHFSTPEFATTFCSATRPVILNLPSHPLFLFVHLE